MENSAVKNPNEEYMVFADDLTVNNKSLVGNENQDKWKLLIVDDDAEVHHITKVVLRDLVFDGKSLDFLSAYSGREAMRVVSENPDIAVILLDVVMEDDEAGLKVVKYIRDDLKNTFARIILRTGQPGQAPAERVIIDYDINDYKEKTELTSQKLFTAIISSLRAYRDIIIIEANKKGLEKIIEASASIFELQSMGKFATGVLTQLISILNLDKNSLYCKASGFAATKDNEEFFILAATGDYMEYVNKPVRDVVPEDVLEDIDRVYSEKKSTCLNDRFVGYLKSKMGSENMICLEGMRALSEWEKYWIDIFFNNVSIAFDNIYLNREIENTQKEIIYTLGEITESRSKETRHHIKRVAEYCGVLARKYGLPESEVQVIKLAAPMHDIGKLGIPDSVLNNPNMFTAKELDIMKEHTKIGYELLKSSNREILKVAAIMALQHHERYDGTGYPNGLKGDQIHIYARILTLADVFDASSSERVYKKAWDLEKTLELIREESGTHFDPAIVDLFFGCLDEILRIRDTFVN